MLFKAGKIFVVQMNSGRPQNTLFFVLGKPEVKSIDMQEWETLFQEQESEGSPSDDLLEPPQSEPVLPEDIEEEISTTTEQDQKAA